MTDELERLVARELKRLPGPRAPQTLLPRVLAAVSQTLPARWYARPWSAWPPVLQAFSLTVLATTAVAVWVLWPYVPQLILDTGSPTAIAIMSRLTRVANQAAQLAAVGRVLWQVLLGPIAVFVLALTVIVSLACAAAWTAVRRTALGGASSQ